MNRRLNSVVGLLVIMAIGPGVAAEDAQWVRVTVLLETGGADGFQPRDTLIPGGVYSLAEVEKRGQAAIDREILERVRHLGESIRSAEESMRLATLLARQYYLELRVGEKAVLPAVDLNPRLSVVFIPERFVGDRMVCRVQFLEPEGVMGTPGFSGEPITLRLQDADLQDVLGVFSKVSSVEIVVDPAVEGTVTVDLRDVPWDQALDVILRINGLGWARDNGTIRVAPRTELSNRKRVRTEATLKLPRGSWGSSMIASEGDEHNPTMVLVVESVDEPPGLAAEKDGLVHPRRVLPVAASPEDLENSIGELAVFRARVNLAGELEDPEILASPSSAYAERLGEALDAWLFRSVLDEAGRKQEAVVGYGVRFESQNDFLFLGDVPHIGVEIDAEPVGNGQYLIKALITDLDSGAVISAPQVVTVLGQEARVRSGMRAPNGDSAMLMMRFLVAEDGSSVSYSWSVMTGDVVVASHSAQFKL